MKKKNIFITGVGTETGKTFICGLLLKKARSEGINAGYYKAAQSGGVPSDSQCAALSGGLEETGAIASYTYTTPVSPHLAGRLEGNPAQIEKIRKDYFQAEASHDLMIIEGSGGVVCPLRWDENGALMLEDVIKLTGAPVVAVSGCALGSINSAVLTAEYAASHGFPLKGLIINRYKGGVMEDDNIKMIEALSKVKILAVVKESQDNININLSALLTNGAKSRPCLHLSD
ncbi:MAG: dethiobiotin synthase [Spirochaetaceae bacterium]|jgi:dethiobiotin synthetase|nr:dethiobiotin synthase [Spirochaetaceae bacterium]